VSLKCLTACSCPLSYARAMAFDKESLDYYFDLLQDTLKANQIFVDPSHVFSWWKEPQLSYWKSEITDTVLACTGVTGCALPPFIISDRKTLNPEFFKSELPGTLYGLSSNGWIDVELFLLASTIFLLMHPVVDHCFWFFTAMPPTIVQKWSRWLQQKRW